MWHRRVSASFPIARPGEQRQSPSSSGELPIGDMHASRFVWRRLSFARVWVRCYLCLGSLVVCAMAMAGGKQNTRPLWRDNWPRRGRRTMRQRWRGIPEGHARSGSIAKSIQERCDSCCETCESFESPWCVVGSKGWLFRWLGREGSSSHWR